MSHAFVRESETAGVSWVEREREEEEKSNCLNDPSGKLNQVGENLASERSEGRKDGKGIQLG